VRKIMAGVSAALRKMVSHPVGSPGAYSIAGLQAFGRAAAAVAHLDGLGERTAPGAGR
jgi:hypothetical protein